MTIAINLRGTGGSGKSTVVRRIMELYGDRRRPEMVPGRRRPMSYQLGGLPTPLVVLGHYETACGGCDTIKTVDEVYRQVGGALEMNCHVLYEGIMVQDDVRRAVELDKSMRYTGVKSDDASCLRVIRLTTPIEDCLAAIRDRRAARGEEKPLNERNTRGRYESVLRTCHRLKDAGVSVEALDREAAFLRVRELLGV